VLLFAAWLTQQFLYERWNGRLSQLNACEYGLNELRASISPDAIAAVTANHVVTSFDSIRRSGTSQIIATLA